MSDSILRSRLPIVAAPMAGGPSTVALGRAVASAGGFPFLAGGYKTPGALAAEIAELRASAPEFGVNLFVPSHDTPDGQAFAAYAAELADEAAVYGLTLDPAPTSDDDAWDAKLALLIAHPVPIVSFTFGLPEPAVIASLQAVGTRVLASVITPEEAVLARDAGVDALVVQGPGAGGHSATFDAVRPIDGVSAVDLVRAVLAVVDLPVVAAGGVDGPDGVRHLLEAGAVGVSVGTMLLRTDEAGTSPTHRAALGDLRFTETVVTSVFTGRPARALRNGFVDRHQGTGVLAYPAVHHLTRALRQAAGRAGDAERLHLWAGTGWRTAPTGPAAAVIDWLAGGV
ncbi:MULTISPECIES: NAD(P)H-dependent flavin oxidoreductase [Miniimonas]|uniref:NAD(P)H-dependent flavin oxidoreductase n=1 Tax=Miniimonas TaxID=947525 RepID=UPI0028AA206B|nr:nitronate monooxygenase [Miniimonas arenae]